MGIWGMEVLNATRILALFFASAVVPSSFTKPSQTPLLDLPVGAERIYQGTIKETDTVVEVIPEIRIVDGGGPICSYVVTAVTDDGHTEKRGTSRPHQSLEHNHDHVGSDEESSEGSYEYDGKDDDKKTVTATSQLEQQHAEWPFRIEVIDKSTGKAVVRLTDKELMHCEDNEYEFKIAPRGCEKMHEVGDSALLKIRVIRTNNHPPSFQQPLIEVEAEEGKLLENLATLNASDSDCSQYGEICQYHILNNNKGLFQMTKSGILKNLKPLNHSVSSKHILSIVAEDCGMRRSNAVTVQVKVKPHCELEMTGIEEHIGYAAEEGVRQIVPDIDINLCESQCSHAKDVEGIIEMETLGQRNAGCDRDYYNAKMLQDSCGADPLTVDLLPNHPLINDGSTDHNASLSEHQQPRTADDGLLHSANVYAFDGKTGQTVVPATTNPHIADVFTLSFWMRHNHTTSSTHGKKSHKAKENILCSSDDHRFNRHHFAVYVRHCKLELLIRREKPNKRGESEFQPAEWRWHLPETCDDKWHHYTLNMKFPQLDLLVDGKPVKPTEDNLEILDDWPLHFVDGLQTKLVIGACWHGRDGRMAQFFHGYLADMTYLAGKVERQSVLACALQCKEQLDFTKLKRLKTGQEAVFNGDMSQLSLKAASVPHYLEMLRKVCYVNHKADPTLGKRAISISTSFTCSENETKRVPLSMKKIYVDVKKTMDTKLLILIQISTPTVTYSRRDLLEGVTPFMNITIALKGSIVDHFQLDYCRIHGKLKMKANEYFSLPATLIDKLNINLEHVADGVLLKGLQSVKAYEEALRQIRYYGNYAGGDSVEKIFQVRCVASSGRLNSNLLFLTMKLERPLMREGKAGSENHVGIKQAEEKNEKIKQPTTSKANPSNATTRATKIISGSRLDRIPPDSETAAGEKRKSENDNGHNDSLSVLREMNNIPMLVAQEEVHQKGHRLTLDKLAADAPRPSLGGPLTLVRHADAEDTYGSSAMNGTGSAVAIVIVVCVGFLLLLIVVVIVKIHSTHRRMLAMKQRRHRRRSAAEGEPSAGHGELAWDDSGMNIIVNPIEELHKVPESLIRNDDYSESAYEDDVSYIDEEEDDCSDDEDAEKVLPHVHTGSRERLASHDSELCTGASGGLEWDDTTLVHSATQPNIRSHTYRV